jgi:hypothetical protein
MKKSDWAWGLLVVAAAVAGIAFYLYRSGELQLPPVQQAAAPAAETPTAPPPAAVAEPPPIENPVPETPPQPDEPPLPMLPDSDAAVSQALQALIGSEAFSAYLIPKYLVRRFVATVDNLPRESLPLQLRPFTRTEGAPLIVRDGDRVLLSPENAQRYRRRVEALEAADSEALARFYFRHYPLFQAAYEELGAGSGRSRGRPYFNDRFIEVIDHLLASPQASEPIELVRYNATWRYADPVLQELSAGQKTMIRIGPDNAARVKRKLQLLRALIAAKSGVE